MDCGACSSGDADPVLCSVCKKNFHAACTRLNSLEKWTKKSIDKRLAWKCDFCIGVASSGELDRYDQLSAEVMVIKETIERLQLENSDLKTRIIILETNARKRLELSDPLTQAAAGRDKIPQYIENEITKVPKLCTDNPWTLIKFLDKLHLLNAMNESLFKPMFQRLATYQQNSVLLRLATSTESISFKDVASELLDELTTPHTKLKLVQERILRPQYDSENFRTYVDQVIKFNEILKQYNESDLVKCILQGANNTTRAKFNFSSKPKIFAELHALVADVEKLELTETMQKSWTSPRKQSSFNKQNEDRQNSTSTIQKQGDNNFGGWNSGKSSNSNYNNKTSPGGSKNTNNNSTQNYRNNGNNNKPHGQKTSFHQHNPNFNKKFHQHQSFQPFIQHPAYPPQYYYPIVSPYAPQTTHRQTSPKLQIMDRSRRGSSSSSGSQHSPSISSRTTSRPLQHDRDGSAWSSGNNKSNRNSQSAKKIKNNQKN